MMGEKKSEILKMLPESLVPKTYLVKKGNKAQAKEAAQNLTYPMIAKPDIGERGIWVKKITSETALMAYTDTCPVNFLLQEFVDDPLELGVFYVKYPGHKKGMISSIVRKRFLKVTGDGVSTLEHLLKKIDRAILSVDFDILDAIDHVPAKGEVVLVEPIGNHSRGTTFLDDCHKIDTQLSEVMDSLCEMIPGFYFGRFDLRCKSYDDLKAMNLKILELNGAGSEPGHIYQPGYPLMKAYRVIFWHLKVLADISRQNKLLGTNYWSFKRGLNQWLCHRKYIRQLAIK